MTLKSTNIDNEDARKHYTCMLPRRSKNDLNLVDRKLATSVR